MSADLLAQARALYNACPSVKPTWEQLGETTQSVWVDKVAAGLTPADYTVQAPAGFVLVTHDEFFAKLAADPRDIMPRNYHPEHTTWETVNGRTMWGWSKPGWKNPGDAKFYAVRSA